MRAVPRLFSFTASVLDSVFSSGAGLVQEQNSKKMMRRNRKLPSSISVFSQRRFTPPTYRTVKDFRGRQHGFFFKRAANDLDADRQSLRRLSRRHDCRGVPDQIEPLGVMHRLKIMHFLAINLPYAFTVPERWHCTNRAEYKRKAL